MSFLEVNLTDVPELTTVPEGEYEVNCTKAELRDSRSGDKMVMLYLEVVGEPTSKDITMPIMLPRKEDTEKQRIRSLGRLKEACQAFGVQFDADGFDVGEFQGATAEAFLDEKETEEYGTQNNVKRFITGA